MDVLFLNADLENVHSCIFVLRQKMSCVDLG